MPWLSSGESALCTTCLPRPNRAKSQSVARLAGRNQAATTAAESNGPHHGTAARQSSLPLPQ
ncbi:hypothetical protein EG19_00720 [Thermoanaerobaculum aquaticum]|uniref:Uncharacterized protein n=1 Tax=Thermoanaerobaculum aquaticum TaxID=1312852 RepID=A0A062Y144_9BACT|nr:hypothetical protein EG19_00720 [Thermoanaerobaculum aquaticum]